MKSMFLVIIFYEVFWDRWREMDEICKFVGKFLKI